jgi:hypothetical protein
MMAMAMPRRQCYKPPPYLTDLRIDVSRLQLAPAVDWKASESYLIKPEQFAVDMSRV